jgi:hypothetical protein
VTLQAAYIWAAIIGGAGVLAAGLLGWWSARRAAHVAAQAIDATEQSELVKALQVERSEIKTSLLSAHTKIDSLILRQRYWEDYVNELRAHIEAEKPPPPPGYPAGLLRIT